MAQKRPVAVDKRRKRIYTIRRIIVFVCALVCCVLAVFSTMGAMRAWPRPRQRQWERNAISISG